ncbi:MAG: hypothetical protein ACI89L_001877 [Phycisphaerales bacterium]|jgi:hypothetical protein
MIKLYFLFVILVLTTVIVAGRWMPWWAAGITIFATILFFIWFTFRLLRHWFRSVMAKGIDEATEALQDATVTVHGCHSVPEPDSVRREREQHEQHRLENSEPDEQEVSEDDPKIEEHDKRFEPVRWVAVEFTLQPDEKPDELDVIDPENPQARDGSDEQPTWDPETFSIVPSDTPPLDPNRNGIMSMYSQLQAGVHRTQWLSDDGSEVLLDTDEFEDEDELNEAIKPLGSLPGSARVRLTFGIPEDLNGPVKLRYLTLDFSELTLPAR